MIRARFFLAAAGAAAMLFFGGCEEAGRVGDDVPPPEVSDAQEQEMCDVLTAAVSTGQVPKTAGPTIDDCAATDAQRGRKTVELVDFEGANGGYLRLTVSPEGEPAVFLMLADDAPFAVVAQDGTEVDFVEEGSSSEHCDGVGGRYLWVVADQANYLRFGPTNHASIEFVVETVAVEDAGGE